MKKVIKYFWPDIKDIEVTKFSILAATLFCTIGAYWLLRLLKDTVFMKIAFPHHLGWQDEQGALFQPIAKTWSPLIIICCVFIYSKLVDTFEKHTLFYVICSFYACVFAVISVLLTIREINGDDVLGKTLLGTVGWVTYFSIESFGSIAIPMFWSFVISITDSESAKTGFPMILAGAQIGSITGSALTIFSKELGGVWLLFFVASIIVATVILLIRYFVSTIPADQMQQETKEEKAKKKSQGFVKGFYSGITIIFKNPYLMGIFVVSTFYEIVGTIVDYQMKRQASLSSDWAGAEGFAQFMGIFGVSVNGLTFILTLFGTSYIMKRFGLRICLFIFPIALGGAIILLYLFSKTNPSESGLLWATFSVMILCRGLTYSLNNPSKDMMYIPTSKDARYKAKGWIEMFGARTAKMAGSQVTNAFKHDVTTLLVFGTIFSLGIIVLWLFAAWYVGRKNEQLIKENQIVSAEGIIPAQQQ